MSASKAKMRPSGTEGELLAARFAARRSSAGAAAAAGGDGARMGTVSKSYELLKEIGEGAYGTVSKARDLRTGEVVAIKSNHDGGDDEAVLLREAALLAACAANPSVVRLREVVRGSETDGRFHLVLEFAGRSLADVIDSRFDRGLTFSLSETLSLMEQLLSGVAKMHAHGVIHRDLKPENVLYGADDRLRICDFGFAKSVAAAPQLDPRQIEGTPGYIAPETIMCRKDCGPPVDVWALGCIMVELVTGWKLIEAQGVREQFDQIQDLFKVPGKLLRERVPEEQLLRDGFDVLRGLLVYEPNDRLTAAAALSMPWFQYRRA